MSEPASWALLFGVGTVAGTINVLAAGGSFLTLPLLIFLGLPPTVANGTNRVAILVQNVGAVWGFQRHGVMDWNWVKRAAIPAVAGAGFGTWAAVQVGDVSFQRILATLMIAFAVLILLDPLRRRLQRYLPERPAGSGNGPVLRPESIGFPIVFFFVGVYGGFVQAGVGFLLLTLALLSGLDLVKGNALKVLVVLAFTPVALWIFASAGKVDWALGTALAAGNLLGGLLGTHLTVLKGHAWVRRVVVVMILLFALRLWFVPGGV
jgi:uncharacterized membrane protein YfcA